MQKKRKEENKGAIPVVIIWPDRTVYYDSIEAAADATGVTVSTIVNSIGNTDSHFNGHTGAYVEQAVIPDEENPQLHLSEQRRMYRLRYQITEVKAAYEHEELRYTSQEVAKKTGIAEWRVSKFAPYYANCKRAQQWMWSAEAVKRFLAQSGI